MSKVRVRQHVNPFSPQYQIKIPVPNWKELFEDFNKPLHIDLGCAKGRLIFQLAEKDQSTNYLGVEIRKPLVEYANEVKEKAQLKNLAYIFGNVTVSPETIFNINTKDKIKSISILYPDPCFKKKHHKRRMVQPELVDFISKYINNGTKIYLASDVLKVIEDMLEKFLANGNYKKLSETWCDEFLPIQSEREIATLKKGLPVYKIILEKI
jgi:tRNA (guanine-N7-)-methyltransferase